MFMRKFKLASQTEFLCRILSLMLSISIVACNDDEGDNYLKAIGDPYNPSKTTTITRLLPESFKSNDQLIIYGDNFGNDINSVDVTIGGKKAVVISVAGNMIYCFVPVKIATAEVQVTINDKEVNPLQVASFTGKMPDVVPKVVGTLCGHTLQANETFETVYGSFGTCSGFGENGILKLDPQKNICYICYDSSDRGNGIEYLDFDKQQHQLLINGDAFGTKRLRDIAFSNDGKYMFVAVDRGDKDTKSPSLFILERNEDGTFDGVTPQLLTSYRDCNTVAVHPINGEVYFNSYSNGQIFRFELDDYLNAFNEAGKIDPSKWDGFQHDEEDADEDIYRKGFHEIFQIKDNGNECRICIHPSGDYAYILVINKHYILKTEYDWEKKVFKQPYVFAGAESQIDFKDGVGTTARFHEPYYGVFVENPEYVRQGLKDCYDFYLTDRVNFCVRTLTPEGVVRIYAGRASHGDNNIWGTEDGALLSMARFRDVTGIAYDESQDAFYILDQYNQRIRIIQ